MDWHRYKSISKGWQITFVGIVIILLVVLYITGVHDTTTKFEDGTYYGESEGYYSIIKVSVTVKDGFIEEIQILDHEEPEILSKIVFEELPPRIIKRNSPQVDVITGATYTSRSFIEAVTNALIDAAGGE